MNCNEVKDITKGYGMVAHLGLQSARFIFFTPGQRSSTDFICIPIVLNEQHHGNIESEVTFPRWLPVMSEVGDIFEKRNNGKSEGRNRFGNRGKEEIKGKSKNCWDKMRED